MGLRDRLHDLKDRISDKIHGTSSSSIPVYRSSRTLSGVLLVPQIPHESFAYRASAVARVPTPAPVFMAHHTKPTAVYPTMSAASSYPSIPSYAYGSAYGSFYDSGYSAGLYAGPAPTPTYVPYGSSSGLGMQAGLLSHSDVTEHTDDMRGHRVRNTHMDTRPGYPFGSPVTHRDVTEEVDDMYGHRDSGSHEVSGSFGSVGYGSVRNSVSPYRGAVDERLLRERLARQRASSVYGSSPFYPPRSSHPYLDPVSPISRGYVPTPTFAGRQTVSGSGAGSHFEKEEYEQDMLTGAERARRTHVDTDTQAQQRVREEFRPEWRFNPYTGVAYATGIGRHVDQSDVRDTRTHSTVDTHEVGPYGLGHRDTRSHLDTGATTRVDSHADVTPGEWRAVPRFG